MPAYVGQNLVTGAYRGSVPLSAWQPGAPSVPSDPQPLVSKLVVIGASIEFLTFDYIDATTHSVDLLRDKMIAQGVDLPFRSYAVSGATLAQVIANQLPLVLTHFAGQTDVTVYVGSIGGNDLSANGAWSTWTQQQKDDFQAGMTQVYTSVLNAGFNLIATPLSYRTYHSLGDSADAVNTNIIYPLIQQYSPDWWNATTGKPVVDIWQASYDARATYFVDQVHPNASGVNALQNYILGKLVANAQLPADNGKERFIVSSDVTALNADRSPSINKLTATAGTLTGIRRDGGLVLPAATVQWSGFAAAPSNAGRWLESSIAVNPLHFHTVRFYMYTGGEAPVTMTLGAAYAGRTGTVHITGTRAQSAGDRISRYRIGTGDITLNAQFDPPQEVTLPVTLGANGEFTLIISAAPNNSFGYLSAFMLELD